MGKIIRKGIGQQLRYLKRNINHIVDLLDIYEGISSSTALIYTKIERSTISNSKLYFFGETK